MIRGGSDPASLRHRADYLGIPLDTPRVLCLIRPVEGSTVALPQARDAAARFVEAGAPAALATAFSKGLVVIIDLPPDLPVPAAIRQTEELVSEVLSRKDVLAALSSVCTRLEDYERAYTQAWQVMQCLTRYATDRRVLAADDLGAGRLLLAAADPGEVERFARDTLGSLLDGSEGNGDLVTTLASFFDNGRSIRRAATALDVHENTIRYRLGRIEEAIGIPVATDADAQLTAQLALLVLRLQGRIGEPGETHNA
jgi:sugar diacid utilization regulator